MHMICRKVFVSLELERVIASMLAEYDHFKVNIEGTEEYFITLKPVVSKLFALGYE